MELIAAYLIVVSAITCVCQCCALARSLSEERKMFVQLMETMGVAPEQSTLMCSGLSAEIAGDIYDSRAPSTRRLNAFKWKLFASWCRQRDLDLVYCPVGSILHFLQSCFFWWGQPLQLYVASISAEHVPMGGVSVGHHPLVSRFLQGSRWLRPSALHKFLLGIYLSIYRPGGSSRPSI